jgi:hypothetical protein
MVSMTGYWNAYKLDIPMQLPMAMAMAMAMAMVMAMAMLSCERKPPSTAPSQDEAHTMIGDFTKITASNTDNDISWVQAMSARFDGRMPDIPEVEIWRTVLLWMFLLSLFFSSLYFFTSLDVSPVQMASARVFTTSGDKSSGGGVSQCAGSAKLLPYGTDRLRDLWVRMFAYVERLFDCFLSFLLLCEFLQPRGSAPKWGDNVMAWLHVTCPGPGNTRFI